MIKPHDIYFGRFYKSFEFEDFPERIQSSLRRHVDREIDPPYRVEVIVSYLANDGKVIEIPYVDVGYTGINPDYPRRDRVRTNVYFLHKNSCVPRAEESSVTAEMVRQDLKSEILEWAQENCNKDYGKTLHSDQSYVRPSAGITIFPWGRHDFSSDVIKAIDEGWKLDIDVLDWASPADYGNPTSCYFRPPNEEYWDLKQHKHWKTLESLDDFVNFFNYTSWDMLVGPSSKSWLVLEDRPVTKLSVSQGAIDVPEELQKEEEPRPQYRFAIFEDPVTGEREFPNTLVQCDGTDREKASMEMMWSIKKGFVGWDTDWQPVEDYELELTE